MGSHSRIENDFVEISTTLSATQTQKSSTQLIGITGGNGDREATVVGAGLCDSEGERAYTAGTGRFGKKRETFRQLFHPEMSRFILVLFLVLYKVVRGTEQDLRSKT